MKYCPRCGAEYREGVTICFDCEDRLISQEEFLKRKGEEEKFQEDTKSLVKVFTLNNRFEADLIRSGLEREGIPVLIRDFKDTAYDGIYIPQKGWGEVRVPEKEKERAQEIIAALEEAFERGEASISDDETLISCPCCEREIALDNSVCPYCGKVLGNEQD